MNLPPLIPDGDPNAEGMHLKHYAADTKQYHDPHDHHNKNIKKKSNNNTEGHLSVTVTVLKDCVT